MNFNPEDLRRHYDSLTDEALLEIDPDDLTATAREVLERELAARNLLETEEVSEGETPAEQLPDTRGDATHPAEELVTVATYTSATDARLAVALLRSAEVPCGVDQPKYSPEINLMVPASFAEQALAVLNTEISEEDLAAQAEAATPEGDADEDEEKAEE